ncbi:MAG: imidazoleglycerol-phosphate dehydratase HisB [Candidatus Omnitrophica bacterium]|nr:imidazoleglycerol-phosphate dehydratase HisB [Candidatus Omnitrophota bacterium]MBI3020717.1 imidazoleglycerol-phosphate dehydratase HisB [Candidatus Omnitrophota bacterium]MBI3083759.1 imidazoleglycerol-phosphate dehydratase HisB [Candidatus Omnitrophota bacterium]
MRTAAVKRKSKETDIVVTLNLDGSGTTSVKTGIPFLDHMLTLLGTHGLFDLTVKASGDLRVDRHHTNEDIGLVLGEALDRALGSRKGITRFGLAYVPMDEALARVVLDISGRPKLVFRDMRGVHQGLSSSTDYSRVDAEHFLESLVRNSKITLHVDLLAGDDFHHTYEAVFKALGRALEQATRIHPRVKGVPSSKGRL